MPDKDIYAGLHKSHKYYIYSLVNHVANTGRILKSSVFKAVGIQILFRGMLDYSNKNVLLQLTTGLEH